MTQSRNGAAENHAGDAGLAAIGGQRDAAEKRARGDSDQGVHEIPNGIDAGQLVGQELDERECAADTQHHRRLRQCDRLRQIHPAEIAGEPDPENREVHTYAGQPGQHDAQREWCSGVRRNIDHVPQYSLRCSNARQQQHAAD